MADNEIKIQVHIDIPKAEINLQKELDSISKKIKLQVGNIDINSKAITSEVDKLKAKIDKSLGSIGTEKITTSFTSKIKSIENSLRKLQSLSNQKIFANNSENSNVKDLQVDIQEITTKWSELQSKLKTTELNNELISEVNSFAISIDTTTDRAKTLKTTLNDAADAARLSSDKNTFKNQMNNWLQNNTKAGQELKSKIVDIIAAVDSADRATLINLMQQFKGVREEAVRTGQAGKSLFDTIKEKVGKFSGWFSISQIIMGGINKLKEMEQNVVNIDTAMTNLKKVTNETDLGYQKFLENAIDKSRKLQISLSDVINQSAEWAKMGYSSEDSMILSEASGIYSVVGEVDNATAVQDLTTAMKSYNIEVDNAITIVDKLNAISNQYATNASDIGEILSNSASSMSVAGNTIDENIAMGVAIREITGDASEAGNTLKVLSMRLRGAKTELQSTGEDTEGMAESTSKLRESIKALTNVDGNGGFDMMIDDHTFKSTYDIMLGLSQVWNKLNDTNQASLIELIAGKQRGNTVTALLTNMAQAQNIVTDSINSSGSAMNEYEKYLDSVEGKISALKNEFEILSQTVLSSDLLKSIVSGSTSILKSIDSITDGLGTIPTLLTAISAAASFKNKGGGKTTPLLKMNMPFLNYNNELCA